MQATATLRGTAWTNIVSCDGVDSVTAASRIMAERRCSCILVRVPDGSPGIWTERDILKLDIGAPGALDEPVGRHMTAPVHTLADGTAVTEIVAALRREGRRHFVLVDERGTPCRIFTQTDAVRDPFFDDYLERVLVRSALTPRLTLVDPALPVTKAMRMMNQRALDAVVVDFADGCHGIFTERDAVHVVATRAAGATVGDVAHRPLRCISVDETLLHARDILRGADFRHLGVTDTDGELIGLLSFSDILACIDIGCREDIDMQTGLHNGPFLYHWLARALVRARREGRPLALVSISLSKYQEINHLLGFGTGERLLRDVARRLNEWVPAGGVLAHIGGNEFAIAIPGADKDSNTETLAHCLLRIAGLPVDFLEEDLIPTARIGIAAFPADADSPAQLIRAAAAAQMHSSRVADGHLGFYSSELNSGIKLRRNREKELRRALINGDIQVHYQPKVDLLTRRPMGMEALARWQMADGTMVPPAEFIALAEEIGIVGDIDAAVIHIACQQARRWIDQGLGPLQLAVNISGDDLRRNRVLSMVSEALANSGLPPAHLEVELTESTAAGDENQVAATLGALREMGVSVAVDDFGTGYSSLQYLRRFPVTTLKIDRSFIRDIDHDDGEWVIPAAIIDMAHSLGLKVVAEGIENQAQLSILADSGCDIGQGWYFAKALPATDFADLCHRATAETAARRTAARTRAEILHRPTYGALFRTATS